MIFNALDATVNLFPSVLQGVISYKNYEKSPDNSKTVRAFY